MRAIRKKRIVVKRNGGNSVTPIFAEINAKLKAKFIILEIDEINEVLTNNLTFLETEIDFYRITTRELMETSF